MELAINPSPPKIMHIDLNSAFAMIEQQANPLLRGKPVGMVNRAGVGGTIIAASYEAKRLGIGVGTKVKEAKFLAPDIVILETDPPKYVHAHRAFERIITSYSPDAHMKSIDEGVIDFDTVYTQRDLLEIAHEIKQRFKDDLGDWVTCNVGIAPNRFLAKLAAGLHKPDGLDIIDHTNLRKTLQRLDLLDLPGINRRYRTRLHLAGILTPQDFLNADEQTLTRRVFHSINGHYWYLRLRGWEIDAAPTTTRTIGRQYVMHEFTADINKLRPIILKMCERLGRRLRSRGYCAYGLSIGCSLAPLEIRRAGASAAESAQRSGSLMGWHNRQKFKGSFYTTQEIFARAMALFASRPTGAPVKTLFITTYGLAPAHTPQLSLFETNQARSWQLMDTVDGINDRFGELVVTPAAMSGTEPYVADKIPFNNVRYLTEQK